MTTEAVYVLEKMAHGFGRMGRSAGRGFYDYEDGEEPELWSGLKVFERRRVSLPPEDLRDRLLYAPIIEALRGLEEELLSSPAQAERASLLAGNFSAATGGAIAFIDRCGIQAFSARAQTLAERYGKRFSPPALLLQHAAAGTPFGDTR
jgi:3-hydroxyacyl-CoA dehydrogenase/enoyl-CoA hydratase/3-hydroxybutyryl-CoA epimerase